jgi:hypothetical protein
LSLPGDLNRKLERVLHCSFIATTRPLTHPWKQQEFVTNNMVIVPYSPYSSDLAPLCLRLVSQIENETEGTTFWNSIWHRKRHSTALRKLTSTALLKHGKDDGIPVYVPKEMAAKIE